MAYKTLLQAKFAHTRGDFVPGYSSECMLKAIRFPIHPAIVHFPIAFNLLAWSLDVLYALTTMLIRPHFLTSRYGNPTALLDISRLGYFMLCMGLITTVPAIMSGNAQLFAMVQKHGGFQERDVNGGSKQTVVPRIKATVTHAMMNNLIFIVNLYNWHTRRSRSFGDLAEHAPSQKNVVMSLTLMPFLLAASKVGGTLVFNHGVGLKLGRRQVHVDVKDL